MRVRIIYLPQHQLFDTYFTEDDHHPLISEIQKLLTKHGVYQSDTHGFYDANTAEAISSFQETNQLAVTGDVSPITYCRLHNAATTGIIPVSKPKRSQGLARANVLISKSQRHLTLFDGNSPLRQYPIAIGKPSTPTPEGNYLIASKIINPGGILGSRWMGLNFDAYGIHGTSIP
ncbi:MAG: ErfK/YbiS/YcfS/YnhG family protein [Firmicutes bacterium]|nr:ErfK/YbiS/YcfS/YnhG family protein [Bacillota bacterium]